MLIKRYMLYWKDQLLQNATVEKGKLSTYFKFKEYFQKGNLS